MEPKKYEYIDVMRGLAVMLVVLVHTGIALIPRDRVAFNAAMMGQYGVQLFFVASALTLCLSMSKRGVTKEEIQFFYLRRFFRIAPLYYVGIVIYGIWGLVHHAHQYTLVNIFANLFFLHGLYAPAVNNIVPGGWSIGCEMLFYAIFPWIFLKLTSKSSAIRFLILAVVANLALRVALHILFHHTAHVENNTFDYYFIINQLPVFACGILLFYLERESSQGRAYADFIVAALLLSAVALVGHLDSKLHLSFAVTPALAGLAFVSLGRGLSKISPGYLSGKVLAALGRNSYSIYIMHFWIVWTVTPWLCRSLANLGWNNGIGTLVIAFVINLSLTYGVAWFSHRWIEVPGMEIGKRIIALMKSKRQPVLVGNGTVS